MDAHERFRSFRNSKNTDNFLNANFEPQILQPTRITEHTVTLIDNSKVKALCLWDVAGKMNITVLW